MAWKQKTVTLFLRLVPPGGAWGEPGVRWGRPAAEAKAEKCGQAPPLLRSPGPAGFSLTANRLRCG